MSEDTVTRFRIWALPSREALVAPWFELAVNFIGQWQINIGQQVLHFQALTCSDMDSNIAKIVQINNKSSPHISVLFENNQVAQYPCPSCCKQINGEVFICEAIIHMLYVSSINNLTTTIEAFTSLCQMWNNLISL